MDVSIFLKMIDFENGRVHFRNGRVHFRNGRVHFLKKWSILEMDVSISKMDASIFSIMITLENGRVYFFSKMDASIL